MIDHSAGDDLHSMQLRAVRMSLFEKGDYSPAAMLDRRVKAHGLAMQLDESCFDSAPLSRVRMLAQRPRHLDTASGILALAQVRSGVVTAVRAHS